MTASGGAASASPGSTLEDFWPWPPPAPSDRRLLKISTFAGGDAPKTWGDVADQLMALFRAGGYQTWGFYSAPGGFAVIPHIEQLDGTSGAALNGPQRWATDVKVADLGFFQRLTAVRLPKGAYRSFVFVLTDDPRTSGPVTDPAAALERAKAWGTSGAMDLPEAMRAQQLVGAQRLFLLLYEFDSEVGGQTNFHASARWLMDQHLKDAGILLKP